MNEARMYHCDGCVDQLDAATTLGSGPLPYMFDVTNTSMPKSHFRLTRHSDFSKTARKISGKISRKKVFQTCQKQSMPFPSFRFTAHLKNFVRSIDASVTAVHQRLLMHNPND
jgi:hypothetical protein